LGFLSEHMIAVLIAQLLHGMCAALFFATLTIYVGRVFPSDVRTSAQGFFNLPMVGFGDVMSKVILLPLFGASAVSAVNDYRGLFFAAAAMSALAALLMLGPSGFVRLIHRTAPQPT
jgi:MFS family permease